MKHIGGNSLFFYMDQSKAANFQTVAPNHLSANPIKWSNTQAIRRQQPTKCLSVFDNFVGLLLKG